MDAKFYAKGVRSFALDGNSYANCKEKRGDFDEMLHMASGSCDESKCRFVLYFAMPDFTFCFITLTNSLYGELAVFFGTEDEFGASTTKGKGNPTVLVLVLRWLPFGGDVTTTRNFSERLPAQEAYRFVFSNFESGCSVIRFGASRCITST